MARRTHSSITDRVPLPVRKELDERLRAGMRIREAADWLSEKGYPTSKSAIGRYYLREVQPLEEMMQRAEMFEAVLSDETSSETDTVLHRVANRLLTEKYREFIIKLSADSKSLDQETLGSLAKGLSMLQSSAVANARQVSAERKRVAAAFEQIRDDLYRGLSTTAPELLAQLEAVLDEAEREREQERAP